MAGLFPAMPAISMAQGTTTDPFAACLMREEDAVLALIVGTQGPSYRPVGATMAVFSDGSRIGALSSGCIEADIVRNACDALDTGTPRNLRYGKGSPFIDLRLPCGGGLDILLLPRPDRAVLRDLVACRNARRTCVLNIDLSSGALHLSEHGKTHRSAAHFRLRLQPELQFVVIGTGPEATGFATLVSSLGYPYRLLSPSEDTLKEAAALGLPARNLSEAALPCDLMADARTAVILFFHDHDRELPILKAALETPAFYIGAQGGRHSRAARMLALERMGLDRSARDRVLGPIGLIPSVRDPRTLAVSVLAEILAASAQDAP